MYENAHNLQASRFAPLNAGLDVDGAMYGVVGGIELHQDAISGGFNDAAPVAVDLQVNQFPARRRSMTRSPCSQVHTCEHCILTYTLPGTRYATAP